MIRILRSHEAAREEILSRGEARVPESVERDVREILAAVRAEGDAAVIAATRALAGGNRVTTTYTVYPSGAVNVRMHFAPGEEPMPEMPRYGVRFRLPERMDASPISAGGPKRITGTARQAPSSAVTRLRRGGSASPTCGRRRRDTTATPNGSISANC